MRPKGRGGRGGGDRGNAPNHQGHYDGLVLIFELYIRPNYGRNGQFIIFLMLRSKTLVPLVGTYFCRRAGHLPTALLQTRQPNGRRHDRHRALWRPTAAYSGRAGRGLKTLSRRLAARTSMTATAPSRHPDGNRPKAKGLVFPRSNARNDKPRSHQDGTATATLCAIAAPAAYAHKREPKA